VVLCHKHTLAPAPARSPDIMDWSTWLALFAASWAISLSPGAGAVAAMTAGLNHGFRRGYWTTLGLVAGIWTQLAVVGAGLGAVVAASATAFTAVKWAGAAYLVWLGVQQWRSPARPPSSGNSGGTLTLRRRDAILRGWMVNAVNPKGTVFLLAVVPQFLDPSAPLLPQYLIVGLTLAVTDLIVMGGYTALAARLLSQLQSASHVRALNRIFGSLFVAAGALLAVFKRST
jgi:homoserine/homoserine lactone efflux protein